MTSDCASCPFKEKKEENDKDKKAHARYDARQHAMFASTPGVVSTNTQECCAERMLIRAVEQQLRRRGVRTERMLTRGRSLLRCVTVWRYRADGTEGCSLPCRNCRCALEPWGSRVKCVDARGVRVRMRVDELDAKYGSGMLCRNDI